VNGRGAGTATTKCRRGRWAVRGAGTATLTLLAVLAGCSGPPSRAVDAGGVDPPPLRALSIRLVTDRPFGAPGEAPTQLVAAGERLLAITDRAVYVLDAEARVIARTPLPTASAGATAVVTAASWDGVGLGAAVRWGTDTTRPAGSYLALTDAAGAFAPTALVPLGPSSGAARSDWDGQAHQALWSSATATGVELHVSRAPRSGGTSARLLEPGLPLGLQLGGWSARLDRWTLCDVEPPGRVVLRRYGVGAVALTALDLTELGARAVGGCQLATSGRSFLVTSMTAAPPPALVDVALGVIPIDLGLGAIAYDVAVAQLVDPAGQRLTSAHRLSFQLGTIRIESVLWDGARYVALLAAPGYRGGRFALTVIGEAGELIARDLEIPLSYEPGVLVSGRLAVVGDELRLLYATRLPWDDDAVLRLARVRITDAAP
jgi:hypothetical protein